MNTIEQILMGFNIGLGMMLSVFCVIGIFIVCLVVVNTIRISYNSIKG